MKRLLVVLLVLPLGAAAGEPGRTEFAYEVPLVIEQPGSIYRAPLSADIYLGVTRADLGDIRVFNVTNEVVAHGFARSDAESAKTVATLPLFPIPLDSARPGSDASVHVQVSETGTIVDVKTTARSNGGQRAYLVDASQTKEVIETIDVDLGTVGPNGFLGTLRVERSDDLNTWRGVTQGAIANLKRGDQLLEQKRITLPRQRFKYLRVSWTDPAIEQAVTAVKVELRAPDEPRRDWLKLEGKQEGRTGEYRYMSDIKAPVDRVRILLDKNSVARVAVLSRAKDGDPWTHRGEKTLYFLQTDAGEIQDTEIRLNHMGSARQWLLRFVGQPNGGTAAPDLQLGWVPHELIFVARGDAPFVLAYGRAGTATIDFGVDELLRRSKREDSERIDIRPATLGPSTALRGEAARSVPWYRGDWKQWLLWVVLVLGVGALGYVAVLLSRQIKADTTTE